MRSADLMIPGVIRALCMRPAASNSISALITSRSSRGFSEHIPFESASGSIGTARSGKYTDVPRSRASPSSDVRDVHLQMPAAVHAPLDVHRIVKIARRLAVDGYNRQAPEILAPCEFRFLHRQRALLRLFHHVRRKHVRQMMLAN